MSLSEQERELIASAGTARQQHVRGQAVAVVLGKAGHDREEARLLLAESFAAAAQPSFHLIPRGISMASESDFAAGYEVLAASTSAFTQVNLQTLEAALLQSGTALAPLRMIIGFTYNELAAAIKLMVPESKVSGDGLKKLERQPAPSGAAAVKRRKELIAHIVADTSPTVTVESKIGEDGGTVRDKAARIQALAEASRRRNLAVCAVVDGKGWTERLNALADVVIATGGRTFSLTTLENILEVPEVAALKGTA